MLRVTIMIAPIKGSWPNRRDGRQTFKFGLPPKKMSMVSLHPGLEQRNYERRIRDWRRLGK